MSLRQERSAEIFKEALRVIPGGVNSPVRAFAAVGGTPPVMASAKGAYTTDVDGNRYIDYLGSWGPLILGHADDGVAAALEAALNKGWTFGAPTEAELELARLITEAVESVDMVRLVNSGTEAAMSAIRLARAFTGRPCIVKFVGCYHGHADYLLVAAGSGAATFGTPTSPGIPEDAARTTIPIPYNNLDELRNVFAAHGEKIAAVIVEPVAGNMGVIPPAGGFLDGLREITARHGSLLIFDEVITGFRVGFGGAQKLYGVTPDMTVLGKVIGGGLPVGAFGGRRDIMKMLAPVGPVYQAGTLSGNPLSVAAGLATLGKLRDGNIYERIDCVAQKLEDGLKHAAKEAGVEIQFNRVGSMCALFFTGEPVTDYDSCANASAETYAKYFWAMAKRRIYMPPSQFETFFVSAAHGDPEVDATLKAAREVFTALS